MKLTVKALLLLLSFVMNVYAGNQVQGIKNIGVILSTSIYNIKENVKYPVEMKILNYELKNCHMLGFIEIEKTKSFNAIIVKGHLIKCKKGIKYKQNYMTRVIYDERLNLLDDLSKMGSNVKSGIEMYMIKI